MRDVSGGAEGFTQRDAVAEAIDGLMIAAALRGTGAQDVVRLDEHQVSRQGPGLVQLLALPGVLLGRPQLAQELLDRGQRVDRAGQIDEVGRRLFLQLGNRAGEDRLGVLESAQKELQSPLLRAHAWVEEWAAHPGRGLGLGQAQGQAVLVRLLIELFELPERGHGPAGVVALLGGGVQYGAKRLGRGLVPGCGLVAARLLRQGVAQRLGQFGADGSVPGGAQRIM